MKAKIFMAIGFMAVTLMTCGFHAVSVVPVSPTTPTELTIKSPIYQFSEAETPHASVLKAQLDTTNTDIVGVSSKFWDIVKSNWGALLMAFLALIEVYIRATPTESDNSIFNLLKRILDALIPNKTPTGGVHP